jgi:hypothetical protein
MTETEILADMPFCPDMLQTLDMFANVDKFPLNVHKYLKSFRDGLEDRNQGRVLPTLSIMS